MSGKHHKNFFPSWKINHGLSAKMHFLESKYFISTYYTCLISRKSVLNYLLQNYVYRLHENNRILFTEVGLKDFYIFSNNKQLGNFINKMYS